MSEALALFPLHTVLLPWNSLPLKIFEPRYSDLVAECLRDDRPFGIVLIRDGEETDREPELFRTGTRARIVDWQNREDGLLGIRVLGDRRFRILEYRPDDQGLLRAEVELLPPEPACEIPDAYRYMQELLLHIHPQARDKQADEDFNRILFQLAFLLPLDNGLKQQLLEIDDCQERAAVLHAELIRLGVIQYVKPD